MDKNINIYLSGFGSIKNEIEVIKNWCNVIENYYENHKLKIISMKFDSLMCKKILEEPKRLITENNINLIIEIIGDGFGDTSLALAKKTLELSKDLGLPYFVLVKSIRTEKHPNYTYEFIDQLNNIFNIDDIFRFYDDEDYLSERFSQILDKTIQIRSGDMSIDKKIEDIVIDHFKYSNKSKRMIWA